MYTVVHGADLVKYSNNCMEQTIAPHVTRSIGLFSTSKHKKDIQHSTEIHTLLWLVDVTLMAQMEEVQ